MCSFLCVLLHLLCCGPTLCSASLPYNCASLTNVAHSSPTCLVWSRVCAVPCLLILAQLLFDFNSLSGAVLPHCCFSWAVRFLRLGACAAGLWPSGHLPHFLFCKLLSGRLWLFCLPCPVILASAYGSFSSFFAGSRVVFRGCLCLLSPEILASACGSRHLVASRLECPTFSPSGSLVLDSSSFSPFLHVISTYALSVRFVLFHVIRPFAF